LYINNYFKIQGVYWIYLTQNTVRQWAIVNTS